MRKVFILAFLAMVGTVVVLVSTQSGSEQDVVGPGKSGLPSVSGNYSDHAGDFGLFCMDQAVTHGNLRLIPVCGSPEFISSRARKCNYLPLKDALEAKQVIISERTGMQALGTTSGDDTRPNQFRGQNQVRTQPSINNDNSTVNELVIENTGPDTVFIMGGEVVKGGKQDRIIAQDVIIPPHSGPQPLSVFCVEHGRWSPREMGGGSPMAFGFTFNVGAASVRKQAVVQKSQEKVWHEVQRIHEKNSTETSTSAYTALEEDTDYNKLMNEYLAAFEQMAAENPDMIGVIAISGGKVIATDIFSCPELLRREFRALLHSYITEAVSHGAAVSFTDAEAQTYFDGYVKGGKMDRAAIEANGAVSSAGKGWIHLNMY